MSKYWSPVVRFRCNGCGWGSCDGHELRVRFNVTSDTVTVEVDGKDYAGFTDESLAAFEEALRRSRAERG